MTLQGKIGFIGGGQMGEALTRGIIQAGLVGADRVMIAEPDEGRRRHLAETYGVEAHAEGTEVWRNCDIVVLAVKPQIMGVVLDANRNMAEPRHLVISIAAGIPLSFLEEKLAGSECRVIRVMPNTPALVLEAASALSPGSRATDEDLAAAVSLFDAIGKTVVLPESYLDAVTGLSGSGPAYVFAFMEALIDAGLKVGLSRPVAETLVMQTILGSVKLAMDSNEHPALLRARVTSPGGTTIAGLHALEKAGFAGTIMDAVEAATKRSKELGGN